MNKEKVGKSNPRLPQNLFINTLFIWGSAVTNVLLAKRTSALSIMVLEESVHAVKPNTTQIHLSDRKKATQPYQMYRIHGYDYEKDSGMTLCIHHSLKSLLCQALESLTLYHYIFLTTTRGPWRKSCHRNSLGL